MPATQAQYQAAQAVVDAAIKTNVPSLFQVEVAQYEPVITQVVHDAVDAAVAAGAASE